MKQLLIFLHPSKGFNDETEKLAKIQIDNSFELGWKAEDTIVITNFPYEYRGVKALEVGDENFSRIIPQCTKIDTVCTLFDQGFFKEGELYWAHDFDAVQNAVITEEELELGERMGFTDYGRHDRWNGGSYFFRSTDGDFFRKTKKLMYDRNINEEDAWMVMMKEEPEYMEKNLKRLNISYNFGIKQMELCYNKSIKPVKVLHFHPDRVYRGWGRAMEIVKGKNEINQVLMLERLIQIFKKHGYE
ncbi:MAG: hypothetical protein WC803_12935 [Sphingomonas sp.]|jgi:hypothetical protein